MPTTLTNGIQLPDKGSVDWYSSMQSNYNLIDTHLGDTDVHVTAEDKANWNSKQGSLSQAQLDAIAQVDINTNDIATLQSDKADASHTHSSSDITDIDDYATKDYVDNSISGLVDSAPNALDTLNELAAALNDDANFATTVTNALSAKANSADLATVATSGSYTDLTDKPTIPTNTSDLTNDSDFVVSSNLATIATSGDYDDLSNKPTINDSTITIQKNGSLVGTFTVNGSAKTIDIPVPAKTSDLTNDSNFVDTSNSAVASGITSAKVTDYDTHIADTDIHVTTADKTKWDNGVSQAFVFRYSSTALVASSTNSNTLLDNTDNLKVGDKVIDSSGVLFSITAIDTQNSTFTIGTALIDLAQDSDVVHKSGDETVGGQKTFDSNTYIYNSDNTATTPNLILKNSKSSKGSTSETGAQLFKFFDKNNATLSEIESIVTTNGASELRLSSNTLDSNNQNVKTGITLITNTNGAKRFCPTSNDDVFLGASTLKWSRVYSTEYYYGANNVEFSTKFVTTDTAQTISGDKSFSSDLYVANTDTTANTPNLSLRNYKVDRGTTETGVQTISFLDKNAKALSLIESRRISNGTTATNILCYNTDDSNNTVSGGVTILKNKTDTIFAPAIDNAVTCGRALAKWSGVYSTEYYYGANNTPFTAKFVTTDTAQTVSGSKTFSSSVNVYNSDNTVDTANIILKNSKAERGSTTNIGEQNIFFLDKNNAQIGNIKCDVDSNGYSNLTLQCTNSSNGSSGIRLKRTSTGTFLYPSYNNGCNLGTSGYRWYDVQTRAVNSLEPSSLSLPSDRSARIDISSYITNLGNGGNNTYTVPANGYIFLHFTSINGALCYAQTPGGLTNYAQTFTRYQGDGQLYAFFPVRKDDNFVVQIYTSSTAEVQNAYFIPCQGNV